MKQDVLYEANSISYDLKRAKRMLQWIKEDEVNWMAAIIEALPSLDDKEALAKIKQIVINALQARYDELEKRFNEL